MKLVTSALRPDAAPIKGRGASWNPSNRFDTRIHVEDPYAEADAPDVPAPADARGPHRDLREGSQGEAEAAGEADGQADREGGWAAFEDPRDARPPTEYYADASRSIVVTNDSPDIGFAAGINPYRGCEHGCAYCYARPTHEYLGFSAGLDFETRILVKRDAAALLRKALASKRWKPQPIALSGNTDAYQPVERRLGITRACLEVLAECRNPVSIITKSGLVGRDADLLAQLAGHRAAAVNISITTLDPALQRALEPRASHPAQRLRAIERLTAAGVPVGVMAAPVIPGLTDHELPAILQAAADAGAVTAGYILLRLPHAVAPLFEAWLRAHRPERADKVLNRLRSLRSGGLDDPRFGSRMRGEGPFAEQTAALFVTARRRAGIGTEAITLSTEAFRRPAGPQLELF